MNWYQVFAIAIPLWFMAGLLTKSYIESRDDYED